MQSPAANRKTGSEAAAASRADRSAQVRDRILEVATDLMARRGYAGTSISAIGKEAGALPASIYWHFGSKEGLLAAVVERAAERWFEGASQAADPVGADPERRNQFGFRYIFEQSPEFPRVLLMLALERRDSGGPTLDAVRRVRARFRERLVTRLEERLDEIQPARRSEIAGELAALALILLDGAFVGYQVEGSGGDVEADLAERFERIAGAMSLAREALIAGRSTRGATR